MSKFTTLSALVSIVCACTGLAHADDTTPVTRAQVVAELSAARSSGALDAIGGEDSGSLWLSRQAQRSSVSRQQVRAEVSNTCGGGGCAVMYGEDSGSLHLASLPITSQLTRAQVVAEVLQAQARGELTAMYGEDSGSAALSGRDARRSIRYAGPNIGTKPDATEAKVVTAG